MKLHFDPDQPFQKRAIASIVDIFEGQPREAPAFSVVDTRVTMRAFESGHLRREQGHGNRITFPDRLHGNVRAIQKDNHVEVPDPDAPLDAWTFTDPVTREGRSCPHFTVEMETGTGKTYVYLRTMFELSKRYGFQKFIIVVPSVAVREGVLKSIDMTRDHFRGLYDNHPFRPFVYDAKNVERLREFATSDTMQAMVMNIQTFNKQFAGEEQKGGNVIYKESDRLSGRPIEFVQAARPIVIIDEPQSVDSTEKAQEAIRALNPLCTLRYSATHLHRYNLMYQLDPIQAFEFGLVKKIVVASAVADDAANDAFVRVLSIDHRPKLRAKLLIHKKTKEGAKPATVTVGPNGNLWVASGEREAYRDGFQVADIDATPGSKYIRFSNGTMLTEGAEVGGMQPEVWRAQIRHTVKKHLEKELQLRGRGIKVLSLFFVDKVANYRDYDEHGEPVPGRFATLFREEFDALRKEPRFRDLPTAKLDAERLHNGYFSRDRKGRAKDTTGSTRADDDTYNLIMKDKERLLDPDEPLRFIFSHSALREGWDNPNVFQICTLNETKSTMKKRQEIGRGLRLPVDRDGRRVRDEAVNRLYVMANESYEDFARALQTEYEEDCGVRFGRLPTAALENLAPTGREALGEQAARELQQALRDGGFLDEHNRILDAFRPNRDGFTLGLPEAYRDLEPFLIDLLSEHRIQRHVQREADSGPNRLNKRLFEGDLSDDFRHLWDRIKQRTTYRVEFETEALVASCAKALREMPAIEKPRITVDAGAIEHKRTGVEAERVSYAGESIDHATRPVPDLLAHLQAETELSRATLARILVDSGRLADVFNNPQRFLDEAGRTIRDRLDRTVVDGIRYEPLLVDGEAASWDLRRFPDAEPVVDYLKAVKTRKTPYEYTPCDSEVEKRFAKALDDREDIRLFVKLPSWFMVDTPVGRYNPDWAVVRTDDKLCLVAETKGTTDLGKLRPDEQDKIRCGREHFKAIGVPYQLVVTDADLRWGEGSAGDARE